MRSRARRPGLAEVDCCAGIPGFTSGSSDILGVAAGCSGAAGNSNLKSIAYLNLLKPLSKD